MITFKNIIPMYDDKMVLNIYNCFKFIIFLSDCLEPWLSVKIVLMSPAKQSFRGVNCFQHVRDSVIISMGDSVIPSTL